MLPSKISTVAKLFLLVSLTGLTMYIVLAFYSFQTAFSSVIETDIKSVYVKQPEDFNMRTKTILLWTTKGNQQYPIGEGQAPFIAQNCLFLNCNITTNKGNSSNYKNFDAIIFNMSLIKNWRKINLPEERSYNQKYVFHSMLPSNENPICNKDLDSYFNWTWSYKLYSDIVTPFIEVIDLEGRRVAPDTDIEWVNRNATNFTIPVKKTKAVALYIKKCQPLLLRMSYSKELQHFLKELNLEMDIFGCGGIKCPTAEDCRKIIENYYFYLAYEESMSEDFVTEEVMYAYDNYAVPIVYGGGDYTKFLPPTSYIEANMIFPDKLAAVIDYTIRNPSIYNAYHSWRNFYTVREVNHHQGLCDLCRLLNNGGRMSIHSTYETFRKWWFYGSLKDRCYPKGAETFSDVLSYINSTEKEFDNRNENKV